MKHTFLNSIILPVCLAAILWLASACGSKQGASLQSVPDDADYAAIIDLSSPQAQQLASLLPDGMDRMVEEAKEAIDLSSTLCYSLPDARGTFAAATIKDEAVLTASLRDAGWSKTDLDGTKAFVPEGAPMFSPCIVIDDMTVWFLSSKADIARWHDGRKQASDKSFADLNEGIRTQLSDNEIILAYVAASFIGLDTKTPMLEISGTADPANHTFNLVAAPLNASGSESYFTAFAPIGQAMSQLTPYLPQLPSFLLVAGMKKGIGWDGLINNFGNSLGTQNQGMLQSLLPYLESLDGTLAIACGPLSEQKLQADRIEDQSLLIYATLENSRASDAVNEINGNLRAKGLDPTPRADGVYAFTLDGVTYRYTARDKAFIFALNREIDLGTTQAPTANPEATVMAWLELPALAGATDPAPRATFTLDPSSGKLTLSASSGDALSAFAAYFATLHKNKREALMNSDSYYDE